MQKKDGLFAIEQSLAVLPEIIRKHLLNHIRKLTDYEPVIGIVGKTGSGKSSLFNALFQCKISPVSDVSACTRSAIQHRLIFGRHSLMLVDLPGAGESAFRDMEYTKLYQEWLPRMDLIIWLIKADDRALAVDERFYNDVMGEFSSRVLFVVNQVDKIEPGLEWDASSNIPSSRQLSNIALKVADITRLFSPVNPVCAVSARTGWGIGDMVETLMICLPAPAGSPLSAQLREELRTDRVKSQARDSFGNAVGGTLDSVASMSFVPQPVKTIIRHIRDAVVSVAHAVWDFFF